MAEKILAFPLSSFSGWQGLGVKASMEESSLEYERTSSTMFFWWEMQRLTGEVHHHNVVIVERISNMDREGRGTAVS